MVYYNESLGENSFIGYWHILYEDWCGDMHNMVGIWEIYGYGNSVGAWNRLESGQMNFLPPGRYNRPSEGSNSASYVPFHGGLGWWICPST